MNWFAEMLFLGLATLFTIAIPVALVLQLIWRYLWRKGMVKIRIKE